MGYESWDQEKRKKRIRNILLILLALLLLAGVGYGGYHYYLRWKEKKQEKNYEDLRERAFVTGTPTPTLTPEEIVKTTATPTPTAEPTPTIPTPTPLPEPKETVYVTTTSADDAFGQVLSWAGASLRRDAVDERAVAFICGYSDIDAEFDSYIETLKGMQIEELIKVRQAQYDRFASAL